MVLTLKVISAAVCYQDGRPEKQDDLRESQKKNQIRDLPSPITFLGYCLNCGTHLAGPVYEIKDYIDWAENKGVIKHSFPLFPIFLSCSPCFQITRTEHLVLASRMAFFNFHTVSGPLKTSSGTQVLPILQTILLEVGLFTQDLRFWNLSEIPCTREH